MNTKKMVIITAVILCFCTVDIATASTNTSGGEADGLKVQQTFTVHQNKYEDYATDLHFKVWQKEDNININGWNINISDFTNSTSQRGDQPEPAHSTLNNIGRVPSTNDKDNGQHAVDVTADDANIPYCTYVKINVDFWLTSWNTICIKGLNWTKGADSNQAVPNFEWMIDYPIPHPTLPGVYQHRFTLINGDPNNYINLTGIKILPSVADINIHDTNVPFNTDPNTIAVNNQYLAPGQSYAVDINTTGSFIGNHIYSTFTVNDSNVTVVINHPVTDAPLDVPTLSEWGMIIMAVLLLTMGAVAIQRKFKMVSV